MIQLDSFGFNWNQLESTGFNWIQLDSIGFNWIQLDKIGFNWIQLDSIEVWTSLKIIKICIFHILHSKPLVQN